MNHNESDIMTIRYGARGKLMITGEYLALKGARCLAWPTKACQVMDVAIMDGPPGNLIWNAADLNGNPWFDALFSTTGSVEAISASDPDVAGRLAMILNEAIRLSGKNILEQASFQIETQTQWPMEWGLGSSSTLLVNIASWFQINPFELQKQTLGGSGYDIACGLSDDPIIFQRGERLMVGKVQRPAILSEYAGFAYLGQKCDTPSAIRDFENRVMNIDLTSRIDLINRLTYHILDAKSISHVLKAIEIHEETIGFLLGIEPVKRRLFNDFEGMVKSLGAWGGDFIMFVGNKPLEDYKVDTEEKYGLRLFSAQEILV